MTLVIQAISAPVDEPNVAACDNSLLQKAAQGGAATGLSGGLRYIARQPILDRKNNLFGYELLFRDGNDNAFNFNIVMATSPPAPFLIIRSSSALTRWRKGCPFLSIAPWKPSSTGMPVYCPVRLPLREELQQALLGEPNDLRPLLTWMEHNERAEFDLCDQLAASFNLPPNHLPAPTSSRYFGRKQSSRSVQINKKEPPEPRQPSHGLM